MLKILWTPRFKKNLGRYVGLQDLAAKKSVELLRKQEADPNSWHFELEKMKDDSFGSHNIFKIALTSGDRMIFKVNEDNITLCEVGRHEVMEEYSNIGRLTRDSDIAKALPAPDWFTKFIHAEIRTITETDLQKVLNRKDSADLLLNADDGERWLFEEELGNAWIAFLDKDQCDIAEKLAEKLIAPHKDFHLYFILGGPGTGKTVVLLNLAINLEHEGRSVSFEISPQVLKYLNSGERQVPGVNFGNGPGVTLLIDDPGSPEELSMKIRHAKTGGCTNVVIGLDPLQWHQPNAAYRFEQLFSEYSSEIFTLWNCYRQAKNVGERAVGITRSLFNKNGKNQVSIRKEYETEETRKYLELSLGMQFQDNAGRFKIYQGKDLDRNILAESERLQQRYDKWKHFHPLCLVFHDRTPPEIRKMVQAATQGMNRKDISLTRYADIRGVEFQELFLFVPGEYWNELDGVIYSKAKMVQTEYTCLHTILSRPKDSIAIFVF